MTYTCRHIPGMTMSETASTNSARLNLRLNPAAKRRLERAAAFEGKTVSSFIVSSALATAERMIREHETMMLSRRDAEAFLDAILDPPKPSAKPRNAIEEHRRRVVSR
jgi:uncharacterized protein (DUF1778 family)